MPHNITDIDQEIQPNAVRLYGQDNSAMDDFPVLKAFQQYIDAEHSKARKRMVLMGVFFCVLMVIVIAVFVGLLISMSSRNQTLNDRLVEYVMQVRAQPPYAAPVVVQPPLMQDSGAVSTIASLTSKVEELQRKLDEKKPVEDEIKPKGPSKEEVEIARLKTLLAAEQEKNSAERERRHQEEIEAYRRKYYPEFYATEEKRKNENPGVKRPNNRPNDLDDYDSEFDRIIDGLDNLEDDEAIRYFDDEKVQNTPSSSEKKPSEKAPSESVSQPNDKSSKVDEKYSIPVDVKGSSIDLRIPID